MKNYYTTITLTPEEIENHPFITKDGKANFYRFIVENNFMIGIPYENIKSLDCRKINVAKNIQESWFSYAKANDIDEAGLCMVLAISGPKALENLADNTVEIEAEAIEW